MRYEELLARVKLAEARIRALEQELAWKEELVKKLRAEKAAATKDRDEAREASERARFLLNEERKFARKLEEEIAAWRAKAMNDDFYNES